jgi:hypothetical protein
VHFANNFINVTADMAAECRLYCALLDDALTPELYHAQLLSSGYVLRVLPTGAQHADEKKKLKLKKEA